MAARLEWLRERRVPRALVATVFFAVATCVWFAPLTLHLDSRVLGGPSDATSTIRDYWAADRQGHTPFTLEYDHLVGAPEGMEATPGIQIANAPQPLIVWGFGKVIGRVAAWNLFILLGIALSGICTFLLLDRLRLHPVASVFGAYAFGFSGFVVEKAYAGHAGLTQAWVLPLLLLTLFRMRERQTIGAAAIVGGALGLACYMHSYYGLIGGFMVALFVAVEIVLASGRTERLWRFTLFDVAAGVAFLSLVPALLGLFFFRSTVRETSVHPIESLQQFGSRFAAYFAPNTHSPTLGELVPSAVRARLESSGEPSLYFGLTTIALACTWLLIRRRRLSPVRPEDHFLTVFGVSLLVGGWVMSLPRLYGWGFVRVPTPAWFIGHVTTFWRVYARFGVLVGLALVLLAALALDLLVRRRGAWIGVLALALLAVELVPGLPVATWRANDPPAADRWLGRHPGGIVANYPLPTGPPSGRRAQRPRVLLPNLPRPSAVRQPGAAPEATGARITNPDKGHRQSRDAGCARRREGALRSPARRCLPCNRYGAAGRPAGLPPRRPIPRCSCSPGHCQAVKHRRNAERMGS